jgi:cysteine desulfurase family protein
MIYLDNAATSYPKAPGVAEAVADHLLNFAGNVGRTSYKSSVNSSLAIYDLRESLASILGVGNSSRIILTNNATQALNTVILGAVENNDTILTTPFEHNSVLRPLTYLKVNRNIKIHNISIERNSLNIDIVKFEQDLKEKSIDKVIMTACSNVTGTIFPFPEIAEICYKHNIPFILDASQLVGYKKLNLLEDHYSAICFPGHKGLLGPTGTGAFWLHPNFNVSPLLYGGTGSKSDSIIQPEFMPDKYESGTLNLCGFYGLMTALNYINKIGMDKIESMKKNIISYLINSLKEIDEVIIYSNTDLEHQIGVLSINLNNIDCSRFTRELDRRDIASRMGLHCAPNSHRFLGTFDNGGTVRLSPSIFTLPEEIDKTIETIKEIIYEFRR